MAGAITDSSPHPILNGSGPFLILEEGNMLFPRQTDHDVQAMVQGNIQQPAGRYGVGPDRIDALRRHLGKVLFNDVRRMVFAAVFIWAKWSVSHPTNI